MLDNRFIHPGRGFFAAGLNALANSRWLARARRALLSRLPFLKLASDVSDVVYLNWVVPSEMVKDLVPEGLLLRTWGGQTILTALTYRHGHFGPAMAGPLRRFFPSPLQSNWRLYVARMPDGSVADKVVLFIKNVFDRGLHAVGTRVFSDVLPSHLAHRFAHDRTADGFRIAIEGGSGSAPGLAAEVVLGPDKSLPDAFKPLFGSWQEAVACLALQDSALSEIAGQPELAHAGIDLPIDLAFVLPAQATRLSAGPFLQTHGVGATAFCFVVPAVGFKVLWERVIPPR